MDQQQQQQLTLYRAHRRRQLVERINHLTMIKEQLLQILNMLINGDFNDLESFWRFFSSYSPELQRWVFASEAPWRTEIKAGAMPGTTPDILPIAGAVGVENRLNSNLIDNGNDQIFHHSPSRNSLQDGQFVNSQSPNGYGYCYPQTEMNSLNYNNGIGLYGLQHRSKLSSPVMNGRYRDHDDRLHPCHQFHGHQRFLPFTSMDEVRGNVLVEAKNQQGSRFLQDKLSHGSAEDVDMIFSEVKRDLTSLIKHQFGHHVIQKLIDVADDVKLDEILRILTSDLRKFGQVCADFHGTKVVQKLVGRLRTPEQESLLASQMSRVVVWLTTSKTSSHDVIYECLNNFTHDHKKLLLCAIAEKCLNIARDKSGCRVLQKCFDHADDETFKHLATSIVQNVDTLSEDFYANYVVQRVIERKNLEVNRQIVAKLNGNIVNISMNKYGSNVVEKLLTHSGLEEVADMVIIEILNSSSPLQVSQDLMGNFVVQAAIQVIKEGPLFDRLRKHIKDNERHLQSHLCGKKVLETMNKRLKEINESLNIQNVRNV